MADRRALLTRLAALGISIPTAGAATAQAQDTVEVPVATLLQIEDLLESSLAKHARVKQQLDAVIALLQGKMTLQEAKALLA